MRGLIGRERRLLAAAETAALGDGVFGARRGAASAALSRAVGEQEVRAHTLVEACFRSRPGMTLCPPACALALAIAERLVLRPAAATQRGPDLTQLALRRLDHELAA